ncbi:MAG TPA: lipase family protein [Tenuifilaceae bacterium]|nr:lipase family protein [Tenuifilaceae bacterium]HPJ45241.1 lipase family protein [Tenuifilaceae bacterium]HPQ33362.1 lipase family protein [Tenuifilaceae bacterium]HRX67553.1 lipase family protein [Tenuifilaceae bacterium]
MKNKLSRYTIILILANLLIFPACEKNPIDDTPYQPVYLNEYELFEEVSTTEIVSSISETGIFPSETSVFVQYNVKVYRITYFTVSHNNDPIVASGALLVPDAQNSLPLLSFQHGTITEESSAPSNFQSFYTDAATVFASTGFIIALPDYIGYGESKSIPHPYEHRASLATSCRDMIRATYEFFKVQKIEQPSQQLFLSGYSEGGFATMATYKLLQEQHSNEFIITGVTVGAGAYNKTEFANYIINSTENQQHINSFVWVLDVYNAIYPNLKRPLNYYFNEPWATTIANYGPFSDIEQNPHLLFNEDFIQNFSAGNDIELNAALADNDCYNWIPYSPLQMYHGTNDVYVPYFNSSTAYEAMVNNGATNVELIPIIGGDHETSVTDYFTGTFLFFFNLLNE